MAIDQEVADAINGVFVLISGFLCFLLQAGFGLLEVGSVREKNASNIMLKNLMDAAVSALAYWAVGFAFAYGGGGNPFIGASHFFLIGTEDYVNWFFQYVFAGTTATIVSGEVAERCRFRAYLIYSTILSGFIYPVVCHWVWSPDGFLFGLVADYSGSGAVHLVGGAAAMAGSYFLGPRIGKFIKNPETGKLEPQEIPGHNLVLAALGTFILWMGFFPFNGAAGYNIVGEGLTISSRAVVVTTLAGAMGALVSLLYGLWRFGAWDMAYAVNGLLGGMVATCSGVNVYDSWIAICIGILGAAGTYLQIYLFENVFHIDDPLNASAVHQGAGVVGLISVGFFANIDYVGGDVDKAGVFYGGNGKQLGYQLYGMVVYFAWAFGTSSMMFYMLNHIGWLRVSEEVERMGMDVHHHGGKAYRLDSTTNAKMSSMIEAFQKAGALDDTEQDQNEDDEEVGQESIEMMKTEEEGENEEAVEMPSAESPGGTVRKRRSSAVLEGAA